MQHYPYIKLQISEISVLYKLPPYLMMFFMQMTSLMSSLWKIGFKTWMTYNLIFVYFTPGILHFLRKSWSQDRICPMPTQEKKEMVDLAKDWRIVLKFKLGIFEKKGQKNFSIMQKNWSSFYHLLLLFPCKKKLSTRPPFLKS